MPNRDRRPQFVGRQAELKSFSDFVTSASQVLEVVGIGGIGKTALLERFAAVASERSWPTVAVDAAAGESAQRVLARLRSGLEATSPSRQLKRSFAGFDELLAEQLAVDQVLAEAGGANRIFDAAGRVHEPTGLAPLLVGLAEALSDRVRQRLRSRTALDVYLRDGEDRLTASFADALGDLTSAVGSPVVLMLDGYEHAGPLDEWVCGEFVEALPDSVRLVLSGRNQLRKMNIDWVEHADAIRPMALGELEEQDAVLLLLRFGLDDAEQAVEVIQATGGWPLLLILVRQLAIDSGGWQKIGRLDAARDRDELANVLLERILTEERAQPLRELLERAAIAPWLDPPMIAALLEVEPPVSSELYNRLSVHAFVERHPYGLRLHERLAELLEARLGYRDPAELSRLKERLDAHLRQRAVADGSPGP